MSWRVEFHPDFGEEFGDLDEAVQGLDWAFLPAIRRTS